MLGNSKVRGQGHRNTNPRVSCPAEGVQDLGSEMAILHGQHIGHVLHHERFGPKDPYDADEFFVEEVAGVIQITWPDLTEPLARRPALNDVDFSGDELLQIGHPRLVVS